MDNFWIRVKQIYLLSIPRFLVQWGVLMVFSTLLYHLQTFLVLMGTWLRNLLFRNTTLWSGFGTKSFRPRRTVWRIPHLVVQFSIWTQICGLLREFFGVPTCYMGLLHCLPYFAQFAQGQTIVCRILWIWTFRHHLLMSGVQNISAVFFQLVASH